MKALVAVDAVETVGGGTRSGGSAVGCTRTLVEVIVRIQQAHKQRSKLHPWPYSFPRSGRLVLYDSTAARAIDLLRHGVACSAGIGPTHVFGWRRGSIGP